MRHAKKKKFDVDRVDSSMGNRDVSLQMRMHY